MSCETFFETCETFYIIERFTSVSWLFAYLWLRETDRLFKVPGNKTHSRLITINLSIMTAMKMSNPLLPVLGGS